MYFHPANFSLLLLGGAIVVAVLSVEAQQPATNAGQSIIFSSPDNSRVSSNPAPFSTKSSPPNFRDSFQGASPVPTFNNLPPAPAPAPGEGQHPQKLIDRRKDWVFMTPAEILGVTTPEKILRIQERDAAGQPKNPTPIERYKERQQIKTGRTNDWSFSNNPTPFRNFPGDRNSLTNVAPNYNLFADPNADSDRSKLVGSPVPNPAQQSDMNQFRKLLEPGLSPAIVTTLSPDSTAFSHPQTSPAFGATQQPGNPIGASFAPLSSGIGQAAGLRPLPGVTRQTDTPPAITPSWAPQPPPWTSQTPQPFAIPRRKF